MKLSLFFLLCLAIYLKDFTNVLLGVKGSKGILRTGDKGPVENFSYNVPDDDNVTIAWIEDAKQNIKPNLIEHKARNYDEYDKGVGYTFEKEVELGHQDKKAAKKIREKTNVLKKRKPKEYQSHKEHKNREHRERKEHKDKKEHKNHYKEIKMDADEGPDPVLNIPVASGPIKIAKEFYEMDPILNMIRRNDIETRRQNVAGKVESSAQSSSSQELGNFREQFKNLWLEKKYEALNSTLPSGDQVNMGGARPWGVKCGDPNQHDMPWGNCMLAMECEPEYRIYRGDMYCGRTSFVCCALELTTYDMYQGFDVSFEEKSLSTDTEEIKRDRETSTFNDRKKRRRERKKRKKQIKRTIKNIVAEINKILNKVYTNASKRRKRKTKQLKRFIKFLKTEYKKNRHAVQDIHEQSMVKIDAALMKKLNDIRQMNVNFMKNQTFADIVVNGTMTKEGARMLIQAYPELEEFIDRPSLSDNLSPIKSRRSGGAVLGPMGKKEFQAKGDYLEYDIEYGFLYY